MPLDDGTISYDEAEQIECDLLKDGRVPLEFSFAKRDHCWSEQFYSGLICNFHRPYAMRL
jgi:hypothetical protein